MNTKLQYLKTEVSETQNIRNGALIAKHVFSVMETWGTERLFLKIGTTSEFYSYGWFMNIAKLKTKGCNKIRLLNRLFNLTNRKWIWNIRLIEQAYSEERKNRTK